MLDMQNLQNLVPSPPLVQKNRTLSAAYSIDYPDSIPQRAVAWMRNGLGLNRGVARHTRKLAGTDCFCLRGNRNGLGQQSRSWRF
jgi:hypothetical protein